MMATRPAYDAVFPLRSKKRSPARWRSKPEPKRAKATARGRNRIRGNYRSESLLEVMSEIGIFVRRDKPA